MKHKISLAGATFFYFFILFFTVSVHASFANEEKVSTKGFTEAGVCKECHAAIYNNWKSSLHGASISDPVFEAAFMQAIKEHGEGSRQFCLSCHSPTTRFTGDYNLKADISNEGITCSFCHTITGVDLSKNIPVISNEPGSMIRGPLSDVSSPAHNIKPSNLHLSSDICGGCHELKGSNGVPILSTYSEWKESPYSKEGIECQNCHMPEIFGVPDVNPDVKKTDHFAKDHAVLGGHSQIKLSKAATVFSNVEDSGNKILVRTTVNNRESGHKLPTGIPSRKILLTVSLKNAGGVVISEQSRTYEKVLVDDTGKVLTDISELFTKSFKVLSDNRIAPKEARIETFEFVKPEGLKGYKIDSILQYQFQIPVLSVQNMDIEMAHDTYESSEIAKEQESTPFNTIIIISFILGALITFLIYKAYNKYINQK